MSLVQAYYSTSYATAGSSGADTITVLLSHGNGLGLHLRNQRCDNNGPAHSKELLSRLYDPLGYTFRQARVIRDWERGDGRAFLSLHAGKRIHARVPLFLGVWMRRVSDGGELFPRRCPPTLGASIHGSSRPSPSPSPNTYYSYIWYATAGSSAQDTITASFGTAVAGSVSIYDFKGTPPGVDVLRLIRDGFETASVASLTPSATRS